jgi:hypothetical protein
VGRSAPNAFPHREQIVEIGGRDGPDPGGATGSRATATTCQPALASSAAVAPHNSRCQQSAWCASSLHLLFSRERSLRRCVQEPTYQMGQSCTDSASGDRLCRGALRETRRGSSRTSRVPYRRFAAVLADANAWLGADVDRYSFTEVDLHHPTPCRAVHDLSHSGTTMRACARASWGFTASSTSEAPHGLSSQRDRDSASLGT